MANQASFDNNGNDVNSKFQDAYCQALAPIYIEYIKLKKKYFSLRKALNKILSMLLHPLKSIAAATSAELTAAIGTFASAIVAQLASAASGATKAALETVFKRLLSIFTSGANEIFGLIALPLKKARQYANKERLLLSNANYNLSVVTRIVSKWMSGFDGDLFYYKMKEAIPYLERAISEMSAMITELEAGDSTNTSAYFNKSRYRRIVEYLQQAISITDEETFISQTLGITNALEEERNAYFSKEMESVDMNYRTKKKKLDDDYRLEVAQIQQKMASRIDNVKSSIDKSYFKIQMQTQLSKAEAKWKFGVDNLKAEYELKKARADHAALNKSYYKNLGARIGQNAEAAASEFSIDYNTMIKNMSDFLDNIAKAFVAYKQCQLFTGFAYGAVDRIKNIIKWLIDISEDTGDVVGEGVAQAFRSSRAITISVNSKFNAAKPSDDNLMAPTKLAFDAKLGNIKLRLANSLISGVVTKSLIDMINFDEILIDEQGRFNNFRKRIEAIPDWDGKLAIWGTKGLSFAVSPYVSMSAKAAAAVGVMKGAGSAAAWGLDKTGTSSISTKGVAAKMAGQAIGMSWVNSGIGSGLNDIRKNMTKAFNHNRIVMDTLSSYEPYNSGEVSALEALLNSIGLNYLSYGVMALDAAAILDSVSSVSFAQFSIRCFDTPEKINKYLSSLPQDQISDLKTEIYKGVNGDKTKINSATAFSRMENAIDYYAERSIKIQRAEISNFATNGQYNSNKGMGHITPDERNNLENVYKTDKS